MNFVSTQEMKIKQQLIKDIFCEIYKISQEEFYENQCKQAYFNINRRNTKREMVDFQKLFKGINICRVDFIDLLILEKSFQFLDNQNSLSNKNQTFVQAFRQNQRVFLN
ncbi:hypothetical protein ABPG72_015304 [Tetrahymena utriculariae]